MKEKTLVLKTKNGETVYSNGHGTYAAAAGGGVTLQVQYPISCLSEKTMARILEQAAMQTGKPAGRVRQYGQKTTGTNTIQRCLPGSTP